MIQTRQSHQKQPSQGHSLLPLLASAAAVLFLAACGSNSTLSSGQPASSGQKSPPATAAAASANASSSPAAAPKASFRVGSKTARDPFFPGSSRTEQMADATPAIRQPLGSYVKLMGIRPSSTHPLALINKTPFSPGEEGPVTVLVSNQVSKAEMQRVNVRCLEIRRDSVLVSIAGESGVRELRMPH